MLKETCLKGNFGKTTQFWMMYTDLVDRQRKLHFAINDNGFSLRLLMWKKSLPLCFATNRENYSRKLLMKLLECLESTHPGAKEEIENICLSVRRNTLGISQTVDLAGEQMQKRQVHNGIMYAAFSVFRYMYTSKLCCISKLIYKSWLPLVAIYIL